MVILKSTSFLRWNKCQRFYIGRAYGTSHRHSVNVKNLNLQNL